MVVFDANMLSIAIFENAGIPDDFRTNAPVERARERVNALIAALAHDGDCILLPAPALGEALASVAEYAERYVERIELHSCFKIQPFGKREAIEIAMRTKAAKDSGDKKEGLTESPWQKVKYDRQIIACAKTEGASMIYSTDKHIHSHAKLWGIPVTHLADLGLPSVSGSQSDLFVLSSRDSDEEDASKDVKALESDQRSSSADATANDGK